MTLNSILSFVHVICIWVRIEVPDRHMRHHRDSLDDRIVDTSIIPLRVLFINCKRTLHDASAKQSTFKCRRAKMLFSLRFLKLIMDLFLHLLSSNHRRFVSNLSRSKTRTRTNFFDRLKIFLQSTKTFPILRHSLAGKQRLNASSLFSLNYLIVSLDMDTLLYALREGSRINRNRKLVATKQNFSHLTKGSKHFSLSHLHKDLGFFCLSKLNVRPINATVVTVGLNPTVFFRLSCIFGSTEAFFNVANDTTSSLVST